jgi:hypothetical protein
MEMSEEKRLQDKRERFTPATEVYREPVHREPTVTKDETYREPRPQGGNKEGDKG